jgi:DNA-binding PadR family transcriptional regulator
MSTPRGPQADDLLPLSPQVFDILIALAAGDQHGYAIMQEIAARTGGKVRLSPGTLYGCIKRMLEQGVVVELNAGDDLRRRCYRLTAFGRKVARAEAARLADSLEQARIYGLAPKLT